MLYIFPLILVTLAWFYPFHYAPWLVAENEFFILLVPLVFLLKILRYRKIEGNILLILPLILILISLIQFCFIDYYFLEDFILLTIYSLFIIFMIFLGQNCNNRESRMTFLKIVIFLSLNNTFIVLFQYLDFNSIFVLEHEGTYRFYGNIGQPNHLSTLFLMGIVSCLLLYRYKRIGIYGLYIISIYLTFFIFLTGSRTGALTLFLLIFLAILFRQKKDVKFNFFFFGILSLLYLIFSYSFSNNSRNTIKSLERTLHDSRLSLWSDSISSIWANPWLGYGVNGVRSSRLFSDQNFQIPYTSSHNIFLDLFLWFGFLGGVFFCFFLIYIFLKIIVNNEYEIFIFLIPFIIHSLLEYPFRYLYFLVLIIPVFSIIKGVKKIYISRFVFLSSFLVYIFLVVILSVEFNRYSRGAFFSQSQKCEVVEKGKDPILMDLMYQYSNLYCNRLNEYEIRKVIYRYSYPVHIQYYIEQGFYDKELYKMYERISKTR